MVSGFLTIGLCTVPRKGASYLIETLQSLFDNLSDIEKAEVVIVVYLGSLAESWVNSTTTEIKSAFHKDVLAGNILVIQPKGHIYPDFR